MRIRFCGKWRSSSSNAARHSLSSGARWPGEASLSWRSPSSIWPGDLETTVLGNRSRVTARGFRLVGTNSIITNPSKFSVAFEVREFQPDIPYAGRFNSVAMESQQSVTRTGGERFGRAFPEPRRRFNVAARLTLPVSALKDVVFHPTNPDVVFVTAAVDFKTEPGTGIWRSTNGGSTWQKPVGSDPECKSEVPAWGISIDPDTGAVFVANDCGVSRSDDLGATERGRPMK